MTSHLNSHRTTDIKPEMLSGVQSGDGTPHNIYNIHGIAHAGTNRKDDIFMQRRLVQNFTFILEWTQGTCLLTKHTLHWAYSRYFSPACCLLRFAAFLIMRSPLTKLTIWSANLANTYFSKVLILVSINKDLNWFEGLFFKLICTNGIFEYLND